MINLVASFLIGALSVSASLMVYDALNQPEKIYHCHAKKGFLLDSLNANSKVFVKVEPPMFCMNIDKKESK